MTVLTKTVTAHADQVAEPPIALEGEVFGHPKGLAYIVFTEAWERFSFYGMQALLVLYMSGYLLQPGRIEHVAGFGAFRTGLEAVVGPLSVTALATQIFGLYGGLVYLMPVFGGLIGDRWLGRRRAVAAGAMIMALGHFLMASEAAFLFALLALVIGSGLLKGNLAAQVGALYAKQDRRRDRAFSIYYIGVNVGAFVAPLVCGTLGEIYGWHLGFTAAGLGMLVGLSAYIAGRRHLPADVAHARGQRVPLIAGDGRALAGLALMLFVTTLFWTAQCQVWDSYPLWVRDRLSRGIGGWEIPITWFQSIDSLAVLLLAPLVILLWKWQGRRGVEHNDLIKIMVGCLLFAAAQFWLALAETLSDGAPVNLLWALGFHLICACGYLYVTPVALALFSRAAPAALTGLMVAVFYVGIFFGSLAAGWLGRFYGVLGNDRFWGLHGLIVGAGGILLLLFYRPLRHALRLDDIADTRHAS